MSPQVAFLLNKACECFETSNFETANLYLGQALIIEPNNSEVIRLNGVLHALKGDHAHALNNFERALKLTPRSAIAHSNKGNALKELNKFDEAIASYNKAISLQPNYFEAYSNKGNVLQELEQFEEAIECYEKANLLEPNYYYAYNNKGNALQELGRLEQAIECYEKAIAILPGYYDSLFNMANAFKKLKEYEKAIAMYDQVIAIQPRHYDAYINKSTVMHELKEFEKAIECCDSVIAYESDHYIAINNKGSALQELGRYREAIACYEKVTNLKPDYHEAHSSKGNSYRHIKCYEEALNCYEKALTINNNLPDTLTGKGLVYLELREIVKARENFKKAFEISPNHALSKYNLALLELSQLNFKLAWPLYENRWALKDFDSVGFSSTKASWSRGVTCSRLFIWSEQGIGDQILYGSTFHDFDNLNLKKIVSLDKKLLPIFQRSFPKFEFVCKQSFISEERYDAQIPITSLGRVFRNSLEDFENATYPYIIDNAERTISVKKEIKFKDKVTCGIAWKSVNKKIGNEKSISIENLYPLFEIQKIEYINLQYGEVLSDLLKVKSELQREVINLKDIDLYDDVDGSLSIIASCDIVVTSSNSIAHLAGALGKETLLLVPYSVGKLWYWHAINGKSLWYPSVRIFEQISQDDWALTVSEVKKYLERRFE